MISVHHANVLDIPLEHFAEFHTLITDPPYSDHVHASATSIGTGGRGARKRNLGFAALTPDLMGMIAAAAALVRRWSCVFSDFESAHTWREHATGLGAEYIRLVPWVRWSQPQLSGDRPPTGAEAVSIFHRSGRKHWNGPGSLTHFARRCLRGADKHPTEKPLDLELDLVSYFSDPNDAVLSLCAGVGTTAMACHLLGRSCEAYEAEEAWAARAAARIHGALSDRDRARAIEWAVTVEAEASAVPEPKAADGSDVRTWERAQRRLADVARVVDALG